ncbi:Photosystem I reaction center subunit III [Forsythia ovata]|uniref:Photosystem I reaction center subunit III n=1 Tax=Forsythia ovata TaxID=205694 RepID=A0ABD1S277_9LAMI
MPLTIPTNLSKPISTPKPGNHYATKQRLATIVCQSNYPSLQSSSSSLKAFSAALALSSILLSSPALPASADILGLTPCKESKQLAKREKKELKKLESSLKLYAPDSAPALAINATMEKTQAQI